MQILHEFIREIRDFKVISYLLLGSLRHYPGLSGAGLRVFDVDNCVVHPGKMAMQSQDAYKKTNQTE